MDALFGAASPTNFSALAIFMRGDFVVKLVLIGLLLASLWSWTVIIDKLFRFAALGKQAGQFEDDVNSGRALEDVIEPFLMQQGFIQRTPRGRVAAGRAYLHLGLTPPKRAGQSDMFDE